ncbi:MAG: SDR family oxidoreductase [Acidimicrobiia bacterium]
MELGLEGRRAAVAASTSGLGLAAARALAAEGVRVAICGRDEERLAAAAASFPAADGDRGRGGVVAVRADVGTGEGATAFVEQAVEALGGLDILVVNGGGPPAGTFEATPLEAYPGALAANLLSVVAMCRAAVPAMRSQGWGRVVAITSFGVRQPIADLILSNTARAGATGFLKTLALEVAADGVTVNSVLPGYHATERLTSLYGDDLGGLAGSVPAGVIGDPVDFGAVVAFLCSERARYVTGTALAVDGGSVRGLL